MTSFFWGELFTNRGVCLSRRCTVRRQGCLDDEWHVHYARAAQGRHRWDCSFGEWYLSIQLIEINPILPLESCFRKRKKGKKDIKKKKQHHRYKIIKFVQFVVH